VGAYEKGKETVSDHEYNDELWMIVLHAIAATHIVQREFHLTWREMNR
jgi:hypothetical protein